MTDLNNDGIPDRDQGLDAVGAGPSTGMGDTFSRLSNDPGVRRGVRIAGRFAIGYVIVFAIFFLVALGFIIVVASKVLGST